MKYFSRFFRLMRINFVLMRYNLGELMLGTGRFSPFRFIIYLNPYHYFSRHKYTRGQRVRFALEALGPIFIKAGQVLSTRRDLLPDDIAEELALLQDRVPPFSGRYAQRVIEAELGLPVSVIFSEFDPVALASASIAQVHAATLLDGKQAVVKVLRPGIRKIIENDVDLLFTLARLTERYSPAGRRFKPQELVAEVAHSLFDELDLMREGANASQLKRNFKDSTMLYIPEIYWNLTNEHVLVMERIYGIPIHNIEAIKASGMNLKKLAERGVEIFFTQVFRDSFFHADMHPGNIFVSTHDLENPQYIAVDFGIVGSLSSKDKRYLAENMLAFFKRDYQRVAELHISSGWVAPDTRIDLFEGAIRAVCEPMFARPLKDISFGQLLMRLFQTARRFNVEIQPQLVLLQKTLLNIEGVGRQIYPDLDIWETSGPYLERWMKDQVGAKSFIRRLKQNAPYWAEKLPEIPNLIFDVLSEKRYQQESARFHQKLHPTDLSPPPNPGRRSKLLGLSGGFILSALCISYQPAIASAGLILGGLGIVSFLAAELM